MVEKNKIKTTPTTIDPKHYSSWVGLVLGRVRAGPHRRWVACVCVACGPCVWGCAWGGLRAPVPSGLLVGPGALGGFPALLPSAAGPVFVRGGEKHLSAKSYLMVRVFVCWAGVALPSFSAWLRVCRFSLVPRSRPDQKATNNTRYTIGNRPHTSLVRNNMHQNMKNDAAHTMTGAQTSR